MFDLITFDAGETIIREDVIDLHLYILQTGSVEIRKADTVIAKIEEKGTFIGEIAAILHEPRSCTVVAITECDLLRLAPSIDEMIVHDPHITKRLLQEMAKRIAHVTLNLVEAQHRLITFQEDRSSEHAH